MEQKALNILDGDLHAFDVVAISGGTPRLHIHVWGLFPTSGWKDARLVLWSTTEPPKDGIYDFDLVAQAPDGIVLDVLTPVLASITYLSPTKIHGVRVHGSRDHKEKLVRASSSEDTERRVMIYRGNDYVPIPHLAHGGADIGG